MGKQLPDGAGEFLLSRYADPAYQAELVRLETPYGLVFRNHFLHHSRGTPCSYTNRLTPA